MSRNPNAEMQVISFSADIHRDKNLIFKGYLLTGSPACEVQRVLPGVRSEGDVLLGAREENPREGFQEKSSQVSSRQGEF